MAVRHIVKWPDPRLRQETKTVTSFDDDLRALYRDLVDTMYAHNGVGIAAIQIGDPSKLFLLEAGVVTGNADEPPVPFINPEIVWLSDDQQEGDEGCLSFPGIYVPVARSMRARIKAQDLEGTTFEVEGEALCARAIQHENDHLTGRLLVDFVGPLKKQMIKRKMKKLQSEEEAE